MTTPVYTSMCYSSSTEGGQSWSFTQNSQEPESSGSIAQAHTCFGILWNVLLLIPWAFARYFLMKDVSGETDVLWQSSLFSSYTPNKKMHCRNYTCHGFTVSCFPQIYIAQRIVAAVILSAWQPPTKTMKVLWAPKFGLEVCRKSMIVEITTTM